VQAGSRTALGVSLVLVAVLSYGFAGNFVVPLLQRYGSLPVVWRAQLAGLVFTAPYALIGAPDSTFAWRSVGAVVVLGALGTGLAFVAAGTLFGRVGATRGSVIGYLIPVVALVLGVLVRDEDVAALAVSGLVLVLGGAWLTSRAGR
jgi:drug/metabolite transporter (DMT)-like permease